MKIDNILISVVLCTYNPREDYLRRVLNGVSKLTKSPESWEFIVIDNCSNPPLADRVDLTGLPKARVVFEEKQGLSYARKRGFEEASGELIVNLDDDAVLDPNYLEEVEKLHYSHPFIGVFGCQIRPEFEIPPTWKVEEYYCASRTFDAELWSNDPNHYISHPWGVGSVVRRPVANEYIRKMTQDERFSKIGRKPGKLLACEDDYIAMAACDIGYGKGLFPALSLTHLIPTKRMTEEFLIKNAKGQSYSSTVLNYLRTNSLPPRRTLMGKINRLYRLIFMERKVRLQEIARDDGVREAIQDIKEWGWVGGVNYR